MGDNIFNFIMFYGIKTYIETNNIYIYYYCHKEYIKQVSEFNCSKHIIIQEVNDNMPKNSINSWINCNDNGVPFFPVLAKLRKKDNKKRINYNFYYLIFFNIFLKRLKIPIKLHNFHYKDDELIRRLNNLNDKYKEVDILIINSQPFSGQYSYDKVIWDNMIKYYNSKYKIITTTKVKNIFSTKDNDLTVKDIAALSINVKVVIAINSGVLPGLLNEYTLKNVKQFYLFDNRCYFSYPKFQICEDIQNIKYDELDKYI